MPNSPLNRWICFEGINPEPWAIGTAFAKRTGGAIRGGMSPNEKMAVYQRALRGEIEDGDFEMIEDTSVYLGLSFMFVRQVDSWISTSGRKKSGNYADSTNLQKATEDALQGTLLPNDRQVIDVRSQIVYQGLDAVPFIGIFLQVIQFPSLDFVNSLRTPQEDRFPNSW